MGQFRDVVRDLEIKELNLTGRKFTWSNDRTHTRIDRAFCTAESDITMPNVYLQALSSKVSDHCPLLIASQATIRPFRGFRFESFWPRPSGYHEVVQQACEREINVMNPYLRLHIKLQRTSEALRNWSKAIIGKSKVLLCAVSKLIEILDVVQEFRPLSELEISLNRDLKAIFLGLTAVEKLRARQASRLVSIKAEEASSRRFYLHANGRRRKN